MASETMVGNIYTDYFSASGDPPYTLKLYTGIQAADGTGGTELTDSGYAGQTIVFKQSDLDIIQDGSIDFTISDGPVTADSFAIFNNSGDQLDQGIFTNGWPMTVGTNTLPDETIHISIATETG